MKDAIYLIAILAGATLLTVVGREELPSSSMLTMLVTFAAASAVGVLGVSLYRVQQELQHSRKELQRREAEIHFAKEVQAALFPKELPSDQGLEFSATCIPVQGIGGDYYDVVPSRDNRVLFTVADISGKGISAAILMANLQARLRTLWESTDSLPEVCHRLNNHVYRMTEASRYATLFLALWDPAKATLEYVNAGHLPPLLLSQGTSGNFATGGLPLGLFPESNYESAEVPLAEGDLLVLFSDGVTEAQNGQGEDFEIERLQALVERGRHRPLEELKISVLSAIEEWTGGQQNDDVTLLLASVSSERPRSDSLAGETTEA